MKTLSPLHAAAAPGVWWGRSDEIDPSDDATLVITQIQKISRTKHGLAEQWPDIPSVTLTHDTCKAVINNDDALKVRMLLLDHLTMFWANIRQRKCQQVMHVWFQSRQGIFLHIFENNNRKIKPHIGTCREVWMHVWAPTAQWLVIYSIVVICKTSNF